MQKSVFRNRNSAFRRSPAAGCRRLNRKELGKELDYNVVPLTLYPDCLRAMACKIGIELEHNMPATRKVLSPFPSKAEKMACKNTLV